MFHLLSQGFVPPLRGQTTTGQSLRSKIQSNPNPKSNPWRFWMKSSRFLLKSNTNPPIPLTPLRDTSARPGLILGCAPGPKVTMSASTQAAASPTTKPDTSGSLATCRLKEQPYEQRNLRSENRTLGERREQNSLTNRKSLMKYKVCFS